MPVPMDPAAVAAELDKPLAAQLLRAAPLLRLAYVSPDGDPRVVPVSFLWHERRLVVCTIATTAKVAALRRHPAVAVTIDHDGLPPRALLVRGRAEVEIVDGVPDEYVEASRKTVSARGAEDFGGAVRAMYDRMARISIEPTWARLNDFETTLPREVERVVARLSEAGRNPAAG